MGSRKTVERYYKVYGYSVCKRDYRDCSTCDTHFSSINSGQNSSVGIVIKYKSNDINCYAKKNHILSEGRFKQRSQNCSDTSAGSLRLRS